MDTRDSITRNIEQWTKTNREHLDPSASPATWASDEIGWGIFGIREEDLGAPRRVSARDGNLGGSAANRHHRHADYQLQNDEPTPGTVTHGFSLGVELT